MFTNKNQASFAGLQVSEWNVPKSLRMVPALTELSEEGAKPKTIWSTSMRTLKPQLHSARRWLGSGWSDGGGEQQRRQKIDDLWLTVSCCGLRG